MTHERCPACERGIILNNRCDRCLVYIADGSENDFARRPQHTPRRRQDQDRVNKYTDYARTKADK